MLPCWFTVTVGQGASLIVGQVGQVIAGHGVGSSQVGQSHDSVVTGGQVLVGHSHDCVVTVGLELEGQSHDSVGGYVTVGQVIVGHGVGSSHVGQTHGLIVTVDGVLLGQSFVTGSSQVGQTDGGSVLKHWFGSSLYSCSHVRHTTPRSMEWSHDPSVIRLHFKISPRTVQLLTGTIPGPNLFSALAPVVLISTICDTVIGIRYNMFKKNLSSIYLPKTGYPS